MNQEAFESISNKLLDHAKNVRDTKAKHYATNDDRLANFRKASSLIGCKLPIAVTGMMIKHTVSIYDMVDSEFRGNTSDENSDELWLEKLGDQINYLLLLYASIQEAKGIFNEPYEESY